MNVLSFRRLRRLSTTAIDIAHGMLDTIDYALDALNNEGNIMFTPTQSKYQALLSHVQEVW